MSRTDKDVPFKVLFPDGWKPGMSFSASDSGFRKTRKWLKRNRSKAIRRYAPEAYNNGAHPPYSGMKRTWDFE